MPCLRQQQGCKDQDLIIHEFECLNKKTYSLNPQTTKMKTQTVAWEITAYEFQD